MIVGVTGGIGSGKSLVSNAFCELNSTTYYHADKEAKLLMNSCSEIKKKIRAVFGEHSYTEGQLNKKYISSLVFQQPALLKKLNGIVHPFVKKHLTTFIRNQKENTMVIYENAILFETSSDLFCDVVISVNAPLELRIRRVMTRDSISRPKASQIIHNQWSETKRNLLSNYIVTNIDKETTILKIRELYQILTHSHLFT